VEGWYKRLFSTYDTMPGETKGDEASIPPLVSSPEPCDHYENRITYSLRPYEAVLFALPQIEGQRK
ncbi:MAG: hypothetical protein II173_01080, partial [Firmicutes bacterium]|nr:hypothetical protein [Bacillota bacterium]